MKHEIDFVLLCSDVSKTQAVRESIMRFDTACQSHWPNALAEGDFVRSVAEAMKPLGYSRPDRNKALAARGALTAASGELRNGETKKVSGAW